MYLMCLQFAASLDRAGFFAIRCALVLVLFWIGSLKFANYEADSIVPVVANSPLTRFFYRHPRDYRTHMNREGELDSGHRAWNLQNGTYTFSHGLGLAIIAIGLLSPVTPLLRGFRHSEVCCWSSCH